MRLAIALLLGGGCAALGSLCTTAAQAGAPTAAIGQAIGPMALDGEQTHADSVTVVLDTFAQLVQVNARGARLDGGDRD